MDPVTIAYVTTGVVVGTAALVGVAYQVGLLAKLGVATGTAGRAANKKERLSKYLAA